MLLLLIHGIHHHITKHVTSHQTNRLTKFGLSLKNSKSIIGETKECCARVLFVHFSVGFLLFLFSRTFNSWG